MLHPEKLESKTMEAKKFGFDSFINSGNSGFLSSIFSLSLPFVKTTAKIS